MLDKAFATAGELIEDDPDLKKEPNLILRNSIDFVDGMISKGVN